MHRYGFAESDWDGAKDEALGVLRAVARREDTIAYSDLVGRISAIRLDPHSHAMRTFLNEISTTEHQEDRGMLSVVVVYRYGDQMPGPGFFELARSLGYRFRDETQFWVEHLRAVYQIWSRQSQPGS
jgi:hypothetical protein